jgi:pheromone shutdown protein TraB
MACGHFELLTFFAASLYLRHRMQMKAAKVMGNKLGGELALAAKEGAKVDSTIVLGDRVYGVTIQRVFDKMSVFEKCKAAVVLIYEVLSMSMLKLKDYIHKTENETDFIEDEIVRFGKHLPGFAEVIINERDEYISQTVLEIARVGFGPLIHLAKDLPLSKRGRVVAVVGAGHLKGIKKWIHTGGVSAERIDEISSSSKHNATWPGKGMFQVVNVKALYGQQVQQQQQQSQQSQQTPAESTPKTAHDSRQPAEQLSAQPPTEATLPPRL